jgi:hypothetical protein
MSAKNRRPQRRLLGGGDVMRLFDIPSPTLTAWRRTGQLPAVENIGGRYFYDAGDVEFFLEERIERHEHRLARLKKARAALHGECRAASSRAAAAATRPRPAVPRLPDVLASLGCKSPSALLAHFMGWSVEDIDAELERALDERIAAASAITEEECADHDALAERHVQRAYGLARLLVQQLPEIAGTSDNRWLSYSLLTTIPQLWEVGLVGGPCDGDRIACRVDANEEPIPFWLAARATGDLIFQFAESLPLLALPALPEGVRLFGQYRYRRETRVFEWEPGADDSTTAPKISRSAP